jgi:hemolysin activation/secretion protein
MTFALGVRAQYAWDPLMSFEDFSAGNYTVGRGYDPGALLGDRGYGTSAEIRHGSRVPLSARKPAIELYAFWDHAQIGHRDSAIIAGHQQLNSFGGGTRVNWERFALDTDLAVPLNHVGPLNHRPGARLLISLTTRLWPWKY